jgi:hypothetical protein
MLFGTNSGTQCLTMQCVVEMGIPKAEATDTVSATASSAQNLHQYKGRAAIAAAARAEDTTGDPRDTRLRSKGHTVEEVRLNTQRHHSNTSVTHPLAGVILASFTPRALNDNVWI